MSPAAPPVLGIDVGGTHMQFGVVDADGALTGRAQGETEPHRGQEQVIDNIVAGVHEACDAAGVAVDGDGDVYVADWMNERIVIFDAEAMPLTSLRGDAHEISKWAAMSLDANPDMRKRHRLAKFPETRQYFRMPSDCAFDQATNRLIVCDVQRGRLQIYEKDSAYADPQTNL